MLSFLRGDVPRESTAVPLFPLKTVLFPGGVLPLKVFEQRYIAMTKTCLKDDRPFGVCLLMQGDEVSIPSASKGATEFAPIGTLARIINWDMLQLGILHLRTEGATRFQVQSHSVAEDGLIIGHVTAIAPEATKPLPESYLPLSKLLELLISRVSREAFTADLALGDASWVSYRLAELLPLPLNIKQSMLEINDCQIRLEALAQFLKQQGLI
jgi:Lon protease-like protein